MRTAVILGLILSVGVPGLALDKVTHINGDVVIGIITRDNLKGIEVRLKRPAGRNLDACLHHWEDGGPLDLR